jgi:hypothetical protein
MAEMRNEENIIVTTYNLLIDAQRHLYRAIARNFLLLLACIALTTGLLFFYNSRKADNFRASFTVAYDEMVRKIYGDRLNKVNTLVQRKDVSAVAQLLGVNAKDAASLQAIKGKNILGEDLSDDLNVDKVPFIVEMTVKDSASIPRLQTGIVKFLETGNAYLASNRALKIQQIEDEIKFIDRQLAMMDSLKKLYNVSSLSISEKNASLTNIYSFSYDLYKNRQNLVRKKEMPGAIQVLDDAIAAKKTGWPVSLMILGGIAGGLLLFFFVMIFVKPAFRRA